MSVRISAVVCTHNRAPYLRKAVQSLVEQTLPKELYEIIVVDNGSQDETRQVAEEFSAAPNLRYLYEPILGLSRARNTGWSSARGKYVAYMDDDAVAGPGWLEHILATFETSSVNPGAVGGNATPIWEGQRPAWLGDSLLCTLSVFQWSDTTTVLNENQWLSGCNVAYRKELLEQLGGFKESLGRKGKQLLANEEADVQGRLRELGFPSVFSPDIVVGHHISSNRLTKQWFRKAWYGQGFSDALMASQDGSLPIQARIWLTVKRIVWSLPRLLLMFAEKSEAARFRRQCQAVQTVGYTSGMWRLEADNLSIDGR